MYVVRITTGPFPKMTKSGTVNRTNFGTDC